MLRGGMDPAGRGSRRWPVFVVCVATALAAPTASLADVIVRGSGFAQVTEALSRATRDTRVVELSGDAVADSARLARESRGEKVLFTLGPVATELAADLRGLAVVSLAVPNPARVRTAGAYVSVYPRLAPVYEFVKNKLKARSVGLLFTPARNREVALVFMEAGTSAGLTVSPIPVSSEGDLVRGLRAALSKVDAVVLLVDPLITERQSLQYVVDECRAARKPTIGFLEGLGGQGVTVTMVAPPEASATAAVEASRSPVSVGKKRVEVDGLMIAVSRKEAQAVGLDAEGLGAQRVY